MKFSPETMALLKQWVSINPGLLFAEGKKQFSVSIPKTIRSSAVIQEEIPYQFAIANLAQFLNVVEFFGSGSNIEFFEDHAIISNEDGSQSLKYVFSDPRLVEQDNKELLIDLEPTLEFTITSNNIKQILKASTVLGAHDILIYNDEDVAYISVVNKGVESSSDFKIELLRDEKLKEKNIRIFIKKSNLRILDKTDYDVLISDKGISVWRANNSPIDDLVYYIVLEANGTQFE